MSAVAGVKVINSLPFVALPQVWLVEIVTAVIRGLPVASATDTTVGEEVMLVLETTESTFISPLKVELRIFITVPVYTLLDLPLPTLSLYRFIHS